MLVRSELENVTVCPDTEFAFDPIPGHEVAPEGRFDVEAEVV